MNCIILKTRDTCFDDFQSILPELYTCSASQFYVYYRKQLKITEMHVPRMCPGKVCSQAGKTRVKYWEFENKI